MINWLRRVVRRIPWFSHRRAEVLACTLVTGECWAHFADHESWHSENLDRAQEIVTAHLAACGLAVLPGVYHHDPDGRATCRLWTFDRESNQLVATEIEPEREPATQTISHVDAVAGGYAHSEEKD